MIRKLLRRIVDAFMGVREGIALERREGNFAIVAFKGKRELPFSELAAKDEVLGGLQKKLQREGDVLVVPAGRLHEVKRFLESLPEDSWFDVEIAPEVDALRLTTPPGGFAVHFWWSAKDARIERSLPAGVEYSGSGWFVAEQAFWHVEGTTLNDDLWLQRLSVEGQDIVPFVSAKVPEWRKRGVPFTSNLSYCSRPALGLEVKEVTDDQSVLEVAWNVAPDAVRTIPSAPGCVIADDVVMPGVSPAELGPAFPTRNGRYAVAGQSIPAFLQEFWAKVWRFAQGQVVELTRRHKVFSDKAELILTVRRETVDGVGRTVAVPALACGQYRFPAKALSQRLDASRRFIRFAHGWLPVATVQSAGIAGPGRAQDGTPLDPIPLTPAEVLLRGSARLEGPWTRIEFPQVVLPQGASDDETARLHLGFLLDWGIPGGLAGNGMGALRDAMGSFLGRSPNAKVLAVGSAEALDTFAEGLRGRIRARFNGTRKDPEFDPSLSGLVLATPKGLESASGLVGIQWGILCLLGGDELIKSQSSKLFANLVDCYKGITLGLFADSGFLTSSAKRQALSMVFAIASEADLVWSYGLRELGAAALHLPEEYRVQTELRRTEEKARAAEVALGGSPASRGVPIPPPLPAMAAPSVAEVGFRIEVNYHAGGEDFVGQARKMAWYGGEAAHHVPFMCYWPTYASMTEEQLRWYFFWRGQVRDGKYPDTDLSYIFVHVYELINGVGVRGVVAGYEQLHTLWLAYRKRQPKLDKYLPDWMTDYILVNKCPADPLQPHRDALAFGSFAGDPDLLLSDYVAGPIERLPTVILDLLLDYRIRKSRFYQGGYGEAVEERLPKALACVDEHMKRTSGAGVFETYRPRGSTRVQRYPFQSAVYAGPEKEIAVATVVPYSKHVPLRSFLTPVVKHSENRLREIAGYRGRLRGYALDPGIQAVLDAYFAELPQAAPLPTARVVIDLARLAQLRKESEEVRAMLGATGDEPTPEMPETVGPTRQDASFIERPAGTADHLLTDLQPVHRILSGLSRDERLLLDHLRDGGWEVEDGSLRQVMAGILLEPVVERINGLSYEELGDILIASEGELRVVAEDFRDELEFLMSRGARQPAASRPKPADLPSEWGDLCQGLSDPQLRTLRAILEHPDPSGEIGRIAVENATMPERLIDTINEAAVQAIGDVIIAPGSMPPTVEEEDMEMVRRIVQLTP